MTPPIDTLLLLALPASGKSEVRRYLDHLDAETLRRDMGLGPTAQLDDYPYVHLLRRISQELERLGAEPVFFESDFSPWREPLDWLTLIHLVNDDYAAISGDGRPAPGVGETLDRIESARLRAGAPAPFSPLSSSTRAGLEAAISDDVAEVGAVLPAPYGSTVVIEFARGGPDGASLPLPDPLGYAASIATLDDAILDRARILYVWVDPEESRRRNRERAIAGPEGDASILHHGVPEAVMLQEYGTDDISWLEQRATRPGTIRVGDRHLPFARFDNRTDRTSFLRQDPHAWPSGSVGELHRDLSSSLSRLAATPLD